MTALREFDHKSEFMKTFETKGGAIKDGPKRERTSSAEDNSSKKKPVRNARPGKAPIICCGIVKASRGLKM